MGQGLRGSTLSVSGRRQAGSGIMQNQPDRFSEKMQGFERF